MMRETSALCTVWMENLVRTAFQTGVQPNEPPAVVYGKHIAVVLLSWDSRMTGQCKQIVNIV